MENKKTKAKNYYQTNKKTRVLDRESIIEIFLKMKKLTKEIMLTMNKKEKKRIYEKLLP